MTRFADDPMWNECTPGRPDGQADAVDSEFRSVVATSGLGTREDILSLYTPVSWAEAWNAQPAKIDWLDEPWLERGTANALFAKPGVGKSLLTLERALKLVRQGETVVYVDDENRAADLVERLQGFGAEPRELHRLVAYSFAGLPPLDTALGGEHLLALAAGNAAALVVIDTTSRFLAGKENDADTFLSLYRHTIARLKGEGITTLRLDHPGKDEDRGQRGSSAKDGDVDTVWHMREIVHDMDYTLSRLKSRSGHGDNTEFALRRLHGPLRHEWDAAVGPVCSAAKAARLAEILAALDRAGLPASVGRPTAREALKAAGMSAPNSLLGEALRRRKTARGQ